MPEPTLTTLASAFAGGVSTITLALLGVDYYSLIWGMVGALLALYQAEKMGRIRSVTFVVLSTLIGAGMGTGALELWGTPSRPLLLVVSSVSGFGAQLVVTAVLRAILNGISRLGGPPSTNQPSGGQ